MTKELHDFLFDALGDYVSMDKVRLSGERILVMQLFHPVIRAEIFSNFKKAKKGTKFEHYNLALLC